MKVWTAFPVGGGLARWKAFSPVADCPDPAPEAGVELVEGDYPSETHYRTAGGDILPRGAILGALPPTVAADGIEEVVMAGLPMPCELTVEDPNKQMTQATVTGGTVTLTFALAGTWTIWVEAPPEYQTWKGTILAT
jgi:hypothetical protein